MPSSPATHSSGIWFRTSSAKSKTEAEFKTSVDADALAAVVVATVDGLGIQLSFDRSIDPHRITEAFGRLLYESLTTESS